MASFSDYRIALQMRDVIQAMVREEVEKQRPRYQMGVVTSIDRVTRKCGVQFPGEAGSVSVNMGSIQPNNTGQVVRVEGLAGDRYIADVIGYTYSDKITRGIELGDLVDLNTLLVTGLFYQSHNIEASLALNYPTPHAGLLEIYCNTYETTPNLVWQRYTPYQTQGGKFYVRGYYNGTWGPWEQYGTSEVLANVDLNTMIYAGTYTQSDSAEATLVLNYPVAARGFLEVGSRLPNRVWQRYTVHPDADSFYERTYDGTTWTPWSKFVAEDDTGWIAATTAGFTGVAGNCSLTGGVVRKRNGMVAIQLAGAITNAQGAGNIGNISLWNIPTGWRPTQSNGALHAGASGPGFMAYASSGGTIVMSNTINGIGAGATVQAMGCYML